MTTFLRYYVTKFKCKSLYFSLPFNSFKTQGLAVSVVGPTLQDLQAQLHTDLPHVSYIFTGRSAGYVIGSIMGGLMYSLRKDLAWLFSPLDEAKVR